MAIPATHWACFERGPLHGSRFPKTLNAREIVDPRYHEGVRFSSQLQAMLLIDAYGSLARLPPTSSSVAGEIHGQFAVYLQ